LVTVFQASFKKVYGSENSCKYLHQHPIFFSAKSSVIEYHGLGHYSYVCTNYFCEQGKFYSKQLYSIDKKYLIADEKMFFPYFFWLPEYDAFYWDEDYLMSRQVYFY
jgi:hypothetical protein